MVTPPLRELIPVLQIAVGPVIMISGVGLLLLTLTNRFGRAIDRSRQLVHEIRKSEGPDRQRLAAQVRIIYRRAGLIRLSVIAAATCVLLVAVLIILLFLAALMGMESAIGLSLLFIGCMVSLIVSLIAFIMEIHLSLSALKLELGDQAPS